jgi:hypothetical protein
MKILPDILTVAGGSAIFYGVHAIYPPAAWILFGAAGLLVGFWLARGERI